MDVPTALKLPEYVHVLTIEQRENTFVVLACSLQQAPCCPVCGRPSKRFHSQYTRRVADLPCGGLLVCLSILVRKCFCEEPLCIRKIFCERLKGLAEAWAQATIRLNYMVTVIGLATSGMLGSRLATRLGIQVSWMTILRRIMAIPVSSPSSVSQLGVDDFSFRRGKQFGTILVDMQSHQIIDLLPDRSAETTATWMANHPEIELVSRDRGGAYASAVRQGAPQAIQVADRFHIVKNLAEFVETTLAHERAEILRAVCAYQESSLQAESRKKKEISEPIAPFSQTSPSAKSRERADRYQQVLDLEAQGISQIEIARCLNISRRTLCRWKKQGIKPDRRHRRQEGTVTKYIAHVADRMQQGICTGKQIWQELHTQGFTGSMRTVYRYIETIRGHCPKRRIPVDILPKIPLQDFASKEAVWLFMRPLDKLQEAEKRDLNLLCQASEKVNSLYHLVQEFLTMVHCRLGGQLQSWIDQVNSSPFEHLHRFVAGIEKDKDAVIAGLTLGQNNGQVEGKVNKLKLLKRTMYGRAGFALFRQRVLHAL
jgi:transposase